jgi:transcriptional regulator with XRE-family HTH domain
MPETVDARCKTIGLLIRRARETAGRSRKDCAAFLGVSPVTVSRFEEGEREPSLVDIEMLSHYLRVPIRALLDEDGPAPLTAPRMNFDVAEIAKLRAHIVGTRLKQARLKVGEQVKQVAESVGLTTSQLNAYELGKRAVPITQIEKLINCLGIPLESLLDVGIGPVGEAQLQHKQHTAFDQLSPEVRAFVTDPEALPFLRVAMHLRNLPMDDLRTAGHALVELSLAD